MNIFDSAVLNVSTTETSDGKTTGDAGEAFAFLMQTPQQADTPLPEVSAKTITLVLPESAIPEQAFQNMTDALESAVSVSDTSLEDINSTASNAEMSTLPEIMALTTHGAESSLPNQTSRETKQRDVSQQTVQSDVKPIANSSVIQVGPSHVGASDAVSQGNRDAVTQQTVFTPLPARNPVTSIPAEIPQSRALLASQIRSTPTEIEMPATTVADPNHDAPKVGVPPTLIPRAELGAMPANSPPFATPTMVKTAGSVPTNPIAHAQPEPATAAPLVKPPEHAGRPPTVPTPVQVAMVHARTILPSQAKPDEPPRSEAATSALSMSRPMQPPETRGSGREAEKAPNNPQYTASQSAAVPIAQAPVFDVGGLVGLETIELDRTPMAPSMVSDVDTGLRALGSVGQFSLESRQQIPVRVVQMIAEAARSLPDQPVQLALSPEELGSVRLTMHTVDSAMNISVAVERPETLELLRRNIELLASELRELGYSNLTFEFAQGGQNQENGANADRQFRSNSEKDAASDAGQTIAAKAIDLGRATDRIDIRL